jgi:hypothetical protein
MSRTGPVTPIDGKEFPFPGTQGAHCVERKKIMYIYIYIYIRTADVF